MKASKPFNLLILILVLSYGIAFAQPGFYPPPSSINYQTDTLTIFPPDSLPGDPVVLLSYNIYVDNEFYSNTQVVDPEDIVEYFLDDETMLPGTRVFCVTAVYNEWISESACDTTTILYGYELPFLEDWSSASFETLRWTKDSDHWVINSSEGNPAPAVSFQGEPGLTDYEAILESYPCNSVGMTEGKIWLDFHLKLDANQSTGQEMLQVQVWNWQTQVWYTVADYNNYEGSFSWESEHVNIKALAMNKVFKIRFLAKGSNSADIQGWSIDNIHIYRKCDGIYDLQLEENPDYNRLDWWGYGGSCIDEWLHWDDGVNSGNSIGTGGPVEFDVAARWDHEQIEYFNGLVINNIAFFPAESYASYSVRIWNGEGPDTLIIDQPVNSPVIGQWNYITLLNPVLIDITKDLWVGYHVNTPSGYPAGVDDGPSINGYGNMMYFEGAWQTLLEINADLNYNWNIACHISIGPPPPNPDWVYNIYRQATNTEFEFLATTPAWYYLDSNIVLDDFYCYAVTAIWNGNNDTCESQMEGSVCEELNIGVKNAEKENPIRIYPNPAKNLLNIESEDNIREVRVYNPLGELVMKLEIGNSEGRVDVGRLQSGIYFVEVLTASGTYKSKVLILR